MLMYRLHEPGAKHALVVQNPWHTAQKSMFVRHVMKSKVESIFDCGDICAVRQSNTLKWNKYSMHNMHFLCRLISPHALMSNLVHHATQ